MTILLALLVSPTLAADHPCDPAFVDACVDPSTTVDAAAFIGDHARVGPEMDIGNIVIGARAVLDGRLDGPTAQPIGDGTSIGRRALIGADADIGQDVVLGRAVTVGTDLTAADASAVGYASTLGNAVTLGTGATVGSLVQLGDNVTVNGVVARSARVGSGSTIDGVVGPDVLIGDNVMVAGRIRKGATIGDGAEVAASARVGREAHIGLGAVIPSGAAVRAHATVPACAELQADDVVMRNEEWEGPSVPGCYDPEGWLQHAVASYDAESSGLVFDIVQDEDTRDIFVSGVFVNDATIQGNGIEGIVAGYSVFVAAYSEQGDLRWLKTLTGREQIAGGKLALVDGALYLAGSFRDEIELDGFSFTNAERGDDLFVSRLDPADGSVLWARQMQTNSTSSGSVADMVATSSGVYLVGSFAVSMDLLGPGGRTLDTQGAGANADAYAAGISPNGTWQWAGRIGGTSSDRLSCVAVAPNGRIVAGGYTASTTLTSGDDAFFSGPGQTHGGTFDGLLVTLSPTGQFVSSRILNDNDNTYVRDVAVDPSGNVFAALGFQGNVSVGSSTLSANGAYEAAGIARFSSGLSPVEAWQPTGSMRVGIAGLEVTASSVTLAGQTVSPADGQTLHFGGVSLTGEQGFVASLNRSTDTFEWVAASGETDITLYALSTARFGSEDGFLVGGRVRGTTLFGDLEFPDTTRFNGFWLPLGADGTWGVLGSP